MPQRVALISAVGLTGACLEHAPRVRAFAERYGLGRMRPPFPAVTCVSQSSMLTGTKPSDHGVVGNGWYDRESAEVRFWKQSNKLVHGEKLWEIARQRDVSVTCANSFWWFNMYSSADVSVTPRPIYKADGRKIPDCYTEPPELRDELQRELGLFPLFRFWGPMADIVSSRWIAEAAKRIEKKHSPTIHLVYLPHLDYAMQRSGPNSAEATRAIDELDALLGNLLAFFAERGVVPIVTGEYGIEPVDRVVYPNRVLRRAGLVRVREEDGGELLDPGASRAFAVCDHQAAHVYVRDLSDVERVRALLAAEPGIEAVLDGRAQAAMGVGHERSGELLLVAERGAWFAYPYWLDDARAPDFARTVEIHRKPGYDPAELFIDPRFRVPKLAVASRLVRKKLGFRTLMDLIPLDASLVRGSHGRVEQPDEEQPVLIAPGISGDNAPVPAEAVRDLALGVMFG